MLMTQLKNQDPTTPLNSNQFTTELVQFSGVEQQINTNNSLGQLIQLTQSGQVLQSAAIVGHRVNLTSDHLSLQNSTAGVNFSAASAKPVVVSILNASGGTVAQAQLNAVQGSNSWTWNGQNSAGAQMPDGAYKVTVEAVSNNQTATAIPFSVLATATSVTQGSTGMTLNLGALSVPFSAVQSVAN